MSDQNCETTVSPHKGNTLRHWVGQRYFLEKTSKAQVRKAKVEQ
jgi:hypothetical protein